MVDLPDRLSSEPSPQIYSDKFLEPLHFHHIRGCNVRLSNNKCIAERNSNYYTEGYVFSQRPLNVGEKLVVQVLKTDNIYTGSLAFGLTSCNPAFIKPIDLPEDSHKLLDRPEYWVVIKDVANSPQAGDEIAFSINEYGQVQMTKNRQRPVTLMHVDVTQRLWGFFDLYGSTLKVRLLGVQPQNTNCNNNHYSTMNILDRSLNGIHSKSLFNVNKTSPPIYSSIPNKRSSVHQQFSPTCNNVYSEKRVNMDICHSQYQPYKTIIANSYSKPMEVKAKSTSNSNNSSNSGIEYALDFF